MIPVTISSFITDNYTPANTTLTVSQLAA